jgi:hypothetical protein
MTGTTDQANEPTDNAEWARSADQRLSALENPTNQRIGSWVLSESADGNLIASYATGGSTVLAKKPAGGETDPDAIEDPITPSVSVALNATQAITSGSPGTAVIFDSVLAEVGGNWTGGLRSFNSVNVPVAGTYMITAYAGFAAANIRQAVAITVDGVPQIGGKSVGSTGNVDIGAWAMGLLTLAAGKAVGILAYCSSASNIEVMGTPSWNTPAAVLSLALITRAE